jgi:hypothetical protein
MITNVATIKVGHKWDVRSNHCTLFFEKISFLNLKLYTFRLYRLCLASRIKKSLLEEFTRNESAMSCFSMNCCRNPSLRLATKAKGFARLWAKRETRECGRMWEWTLTLPNELPCWELESQRTFEFLEKNCKGQNPSPWGVFYIIRKILRRRCLKWARMIHLDI